MSSAETTHPIEWRDDGAGGQAARLSGTVVGHVGQSIWTDRPGWTASLRRVGTATRVWSGFETFPTASAARSFVEKSVKEAGQ